MGVVVGGRECEHRAKLGLGLRPAVDPEVGDPDNFFFLRGCAAARAGGQNLSKWCNKEYDDLLNQAKKLVKQDERAEIYKKMQVIEHEEAPDFKLAHSMHPGSPHYAARVRELE